MGLWDIFGSSDNKHDDSEILWNKVRTDAEIGAGLGTAAFPIIGTLLGGLAGGVYGAFTEDDGGAHAEQRKKAEMAELDARMKGAQSREEKERIRLERERLYKEWRR